MASKDLVVGKKKILKKKSFTMPGGIHYREVALPSKRKAYVFYDDQLGELGRLIIFSQQGQNQWICEVFGNPTDPLTQKRRELFTPLAHRLLKQKGWALIENQ